MLLYYCFSVLWLLAHKIKESLDFNNSNHEAELKMTMFQALFSDK